MTQPPIDPAGRDVVADPSPTEPVPVVTPPVFAAPEPPVFAAPEPPVFAAPEPPAAGTPPPARAGGSSRILTVALGAAILVGAVGIAFAAGRATSPVAGTANVPAADDRTGGMGGGIGPDGMGGGVGPGGMGPSDGDRGFAPGGGPGPGGVGVGVGLSGTVTAVTPDGITIRTDGGQVITVGLDGSTTYHRQADAFASDIATGTRVQVTPGGRFEPTQGANGEIDLGTAGDITIVP